MSMKLPKKEDVAVDMAPMIDMVFLLLIFFMVASVVTTQKIEVDIPMAKHGKVPEVSKDRIMLSVDANDQIYYGQQIVTKDDLKKLLNEQLDLDPNLRVMIRADANVQYKTNKEIMMICAAAGATDLIYATFEE